MELRLWIDVLSESLKDLDLRFSHILPSGYGMPIQGGESHSIEVDNSDLIDPRP